MDHLDALAAMWSDADTMKHIGAGKPWSRDDVAHRLQRAITMHQQLGMAFWTVKLTETTEIIGQAGVVPIEGKNPSPPDWPIELGYRFARAHWGHGYATEAARAVAAYATDPAGPLNLTKIIAVAHPENTASDNVLIKTGFCRVGLSGRFYGVECMVYRAFAKTWHPMAVLPPVACPCCGSLTLHGRDVFNICPVCYWEDDGQDEEDASIVRGGPNADLSLMQARVNYQTFGACCREMLQHVRPRRPEEHP